MSKNTEIVRCLRLVFQKSTHFKKKFENYTIEDLKAIELNGILKILSRLLLDPESTKYVVKYFRKLFLDILQVAFDLQNPENRIYNISLKNAVILSELIDLHPDTAGFILKYYEKFPAPFSISTNNTEKRRKIVVGNHDDYDLIKACSKFLKLNPEYFKNNWNWSDFFEKYRKISDVKTRWIFCKCVSIYSGMSEMNYQKYLKTQFTQEEIMKCEVNDNKANIKPNINIDDTSLEDNSDFIINTVLGTKQDKIIDGTDLVEVQSTRENLENLALAIVTGKAVSLLGSVGSGKTSLVEYVASKSGRILGKDFIKVQLGDQTDSKMLLGTYVSTDIPGEFVWQPGILTQAVIEGSWILLEDLDSASLDIACVLRGLIENNYLTVPGYRDYLQIKPGFHLFTTQRLLSTVSGYHKKHTSSNNLLDKHFLNINIKPLTENELIEIIKHRYPILATISNRIVDVFTKLSSTVELNSRNGRLISTRDLFKWCERSVIDYEVSSSKSALKVLQDAIDTFCCFLPEVEDRFKYAKIISTNLGIVDEKAKYFCYNHKPDMRLSPEVLHIGRASIKRSDILVSRGTFCFTRPTTCLLERIIMCTNLNEPILLVGETGTGKTTAIQYLAQTIGHKLTVINMNQQSDSADLLGGYKPVDLKYIVNPIKKEFETSFKSYFNPASNKKFLENINYCYNENSWETLYQLMKKSYDAAIKRLHKANNEKDLNHLTAWKLVGQKLSKLQVHLKHKNVLAFNFIEGSLVRAVSKGHWVLLDEINLANAETLECLSGLLESANASINLLERGDKKQIKRHKDFKLFACMNPSTDVGKKDLPAGLRNRFTEFFVEELMDRSDLLLLVNNYLLALSLPASKLENIVTFYLHIRKEALNKLNDGLGHRPHFSLRSLCRALSIAARNPCGVFNRSLYEAFCLSFLTQLDAESYKFVEALITKYMLGGIENRKAILNQPIARPKTNAECLQFEGYWITKGDLEVLTQTDYILTKSVRNNLKDLVRIVSIGKLPVLLQGNTSVGKTSLITYLAKASGYKCVRINNHEHTDLQEYVGTYVADQEGKLVFQKGLLVEAMIKGHWLILDELNLAPSDVLEALNRVLDDNRELYIPETQETIKAHPNFMLFATQNPPGLYGGRKMLSRAFRNRFVELHFEEIPHSELETILQQKCAMAPSYAKKMINVFKDLQVRRRGSATFAGKHGFITLRDLFRWGERYRLAKITEKFYDWDQHLAHEGYLLLAGKVRRSDERNEIAVVIEKNLKRKIDPDTLFNLSEDSSPVTKPILKKLLDHEFKGTTIVWTQNMRMLAVLVYKAMQFNEPVLLVGETGGGKTTLCSVLAECNAQDLITLNCHMHTESSDFLGGLRPIRDHTEENLNKIFEWVDGPLVQALLKGSLFLADEISLADDSVLERLNSLLEPERTLLLAEKGCDMKDAQTITAHKSFRFIGTMNPGGDYGKKELSPALRNRFTEIWCETCHNLQDLHDIVAHNLDNLIDKNEVATKIITFVEWFKIQEIGRRFLLNVRDLITWANFINKNSGNIGLPLAYYHGVCLTLLDNLGCGNTSHERSEDLEKFNGDCLKFITKQFNKNISNKLEGNVEIIRDKFGLNPFYVNLGPDIICNENFTFETPNSRLNALRLLRGLQLKKPILLEGSPGVGKSSLVVALAKASGNRIFRINLSDQTDISDLFGADLPVEGGKAGEFSWKDGPLLQALKQGCWILLDELNLASQSVLEGLNACLDHRGEIFIPELGKTFYVQKGTKFFGCQNPVKQGGARKGLPQSFLNRFTQIYLKPLSHEDVYFILSQQFKEISVDMLEKMVLFNSKINAEQARGGFGLKGGPFEFNLRDLMRWCQTLNPSQDINAGSTVDLIYGSRLRTPNDRIKIEEMYRNLLDSPFGGFASISHVTKDVAYFGDAHLPRALDFVNQHVLNQDKEGLLLRDQVGIFRKLSYCVNFNWLAILVGPPVVGKTEIVKTLAKLCGKTLRTLAVTSAMDTTDIIGGFEQTNYVRHLEEMLDRTKPILYKTLQEQFFTKRYDYLIKLLHLWEKLISFNQADENSVTITKFLQKLNCLIDLWEHLESKLSDEDLITLNKLRIQSNTVKKSVVEENSLNSGGKFEWIDSILVKCLYEGSWLLIDDVNLCNPAVLDRLNAVLEPNGVLTINERGLNDKGEMVQIKPHKDFRLFFTMDPKNGEISRAMRNRGVEIFVSPIENSLDIKSLINKQGLNNEDLIDALLEIHDYICSATLGENPNLENILQAAFLISQQIKRGQNIKPSFTKSVMQVYINLKQDSEFNVIDIKLHLTTKIGEIFSKKIKNNEYNKNSTLSTTTLEINSQKEQILQQLIPIKKYNGQNMHMYLHALHYLMHSSKDDLHLRLEFLKQTFGNKLLVIENYIKEFVSTRCALIESHLPIDWRWVPETRYKYDYKDKKIENVEFSVNQLMLQIHFLFCTKLNIEPYEIMKKNENFSILSYLNTARTKNMPLKFDDPVLTNILDLFEAYDEFMTQNVRSTPRTDNIPNILHGFQYRFILHKFLSIKIGNLNECDDAYINNLHLYYKWFIRAYNIFGLKYNPTPYTCVDDKVNGVISKINADLPFYNSRVSQLGKRYWKRTPHLPAPKSSEEIIENHKLNTIMNTTDFYDKNNTISIKDVISNIKHRNEILTTDTPNVNSNNLKLYPIFDYFCLLQIINYRIDNNVQTIKLFLNQITIPVRLLHKALNYNEVNNSLSGLKTEVTSYLKNSACLKPTDFGFDCEFLNPHVSTLSYLCSDLILEDINKDSAIITTELGNIHEYGEFYNKINNVLWKNLSQLSDADYDYMKMEKEYLNKEVTVFMKDLICIMKNPANVSSDEALKMVEELIFLNKDNKLLSLLQSLIICWSITDEITTINTISKIYILLNYIRAYLCSKVPRVDPLHKKIMENECYNSVISALNSFAESFKEQNKIFSSTTTTLHELVSITEDNVKTLSKNKRDVTGELKGRLGEIKYHTVLKVLDDAFETILSPKKVLEIYLDLEEIFGKINSNVETTSILSKVNQYKAMAHSYESLINHLKTFRINFPDIIEPVLSFINEFTYGLNLKLSLLVKMIKRNECAKMNINIDDCLKNLVKLPILNKECNNYKKIVRYCMDSNLHKLVHHVLEDDILYERVTFSLLKSSLIELNNLCAIEGKFSPKLRTELFSEFFNFTNTFVEIWVQQEETKCLKKQEDESLYKMKTKCDPSSDEEVTEEEFKIMFPSYHDQDFADIQISDVMQDDNEMELTMDNKNCELIRHEDVVFIAKMHSQFVINNTKCEWIPSSLNCQSVDDVTPFLQRFKLFKLLIKKIGDGTSYKIDKEVIVSLGVLISYAKNFQDENTLGKDYNFYKDTNISEAKSCIQILQDLLLKINELLQEWPDFPLLQNIKLVAERILSFDVKSPITRFLTGFDILLKQCHDWEQNAHTGVSISPHIINISQQLITWRKIEMNNWKSALDTTFNKLNETAWKYWFFFYNLIKEFIEKKNISAPDLIKTLENFILQSNLAEFETRVQLLYVFHCHGVNLTKTSEQEQFVNILWNLHKHYEQFLPLVQERTKKIRTPIEKKLIDYIKIVKWKDISYWALKNTLEKTHKTIYKFMREYKDSLNEKVTSLILNSAASNPDLSITSEDNLHDDNKFIVDSSLYTSKLQMMRIHDDEESLLNMKHYQQSKKLCQKLIKDMNYQDLIRNLDDFTTNVILTMDHLQNLQPQANISKEKRLSQVKGHLQQKQRALSELFKTLNKIGLSFRKGIIELNRSTAVEFESMSPIDIKAALSYLPQLQCDEKLLISWNGAEKYYRKTAMRLKILGEVFKNPHKELGLQNLERCKGFSHNLFILINHQKSELSQHLSQFYNLRYYLNVLKQAQSETSHIEITKVNNLRLVLQNIVIITKQYGIILKAYCSNNSDTQLIPILKSNKHFIESKNDELWTNLNGYFSKIHISAKKLLHDLLEIKYAPFGNVCQPIYVPIDNITKIANEIKLIINLLKKCSEIFKDLPMGESVNWIYNELFLVLKTIDCVDNKRIDYDINSIKKDCDDLVKNSLITMQNIIKKYKDTKFLGESEEDLVHDKHLKELIMKNMFDDLRTLNVEKVLKKIENLITNLKGTHPNFFKYCITNTTPFLEQLVLLYEYFITQLVSGYRTSCKMSSILNAIFIQLATKGFCIPPDLSDEIDKEGEGKTSQGMGLGDGEGEKNVSDRIESEDQLEDTEIPGQEKNEEDKDCKEDKGIEMSEDFDSKLQDMEKPEDDDEDDKNSTNSDNEQMGDVDDSAEQLDKEVWGSDNEEEEGEDEGNDEKGTGGESLGEDTLAANDGKPEDEKENDNDDKGEKEKEKSKKDINEMDDPDYDDEQVDPYHGNQPELPEPEALDLTDDLNLDDGDDDDKESGITNDMDIDAIKDVMDDVEEPDQPEDEQPTQEDDNKDKASDGSDSETENDPTTEENDNKKESPEIDQTPDKIEDGEDELEDNKKSGGDQQNTNEDKVETTNLDNKNSNDNVQTDTSADKSECQESYQESSKEEKGVGQSDMQNSDTGHSGQSQKKQSSKQSENNSLSRNKPSKAKSERSLGDTSKPARKKMKTMEHHEDTNENDTEDGKHKESADLYQHVKEAKEIMDQVYDSVTNDEHADQERPKVGDENDEEMNESENLIEEDIDDVEMTEGTEVLPEKNEKQQKNGDKLKEGNEGETNKESDKMEIEGDLLETQTVGRSDESTYHTQYNQINYNLPTVSIEDILRIRNEVESELSKWQEAPSNFEAEQAWEKISSLVSSLARDLSEQLRLVLEPTQLSHLKGDYRTGRRINMRKIIPYIASQFRKDKIWLRRTKPQKRDYQIVLAIDDSSSMADNHSKELAFESVALISKALSLLESGQLSVLSFGECTQVLHKLTDTFTDKSGVKLLQKFTFEQKKTCVAKLLNFVTEMFNSTPSSHSGQLANLLIIVSDGRGIFSEGESVVQQAVRLAKQSNIFLVFVIVDNPISSSSILDIRKPVFKNGNVVEIASYMDSFPFPFYVILRDINTLPSVLSDALRQWFEIVSSVEQ